MCLCKETKTPGETEIGREAGEQKKKRWSK